MSNVIQFPTGFLARTGRASYSIHIEPTDKGFDWSLSTEGDEFPLEGDLASDMAAIALSLQPPRRSFLARLIALFTGDPE